MNPPGKRTGRHAMLHAFYHLSFHHVALERPVSANKKPEASSQAPGQMAYDMLTDQSSMVSRQSAMLQSAHNCTPAI